MTDTQNGIAPETEGKVNTDRELWREREGDYYSDALFVTEGGGIGMNVGGACIVKPIREWFAALHRLHTQSPLSQGGEAPVCPNCGCKLPGEHLLDCDPAPGAEAVAEHRQCFTHFDGCCSPTTDCCCQQIVRKSRNDKLAARRPAIPASKAEQPRNPYAWSPGPTPAQGVAVTEEMVRAAVNSYQNTCSWNHPRGAMRAALEAALRPAET